MITFSRHSFGGWLLLVLLQVVASSAFALNMMFEHVQPAEAGRNSAFNNLVAITQDPQGFIWLAGPENLVRYDGVEFKSYDASPTDPSNRCGQFIHSLLVDAKGELWVGSESGFCHYRRELDSFEPVTITELGANNTVYALAEDTKGNLYIADNGRLVILDAQRKRASQLRLPPSLSSNSGTSLRALLVDSSNRLWMGTSDAGLLMIDLDKGLDAPNLQILQHKAEDASSIAGTRVESLRENGRGQLWVGYYQAGVDLLDIASLKVVRHWGDLGTNGSNSVWQIMRDSRNNFWFTTDGAGLMRYDPVSESFEHQRHQEANPNSLASDKTVGIFEDAQKNLWITAFPRGIHLYTSTNSQVRNFQQASPGQPLQLNHNGVLSFMETPDQNIWVGTEMGINRYDPATGRFENLSDPAGPLHLPLKPITCMAIDEAGNYWIGTWGDGVYRLNRGTGQLQHFSADGEQGSIHSNIIWDILPNPDGSLWFATQGGGLNRYDPLSKTFTATMPLNDGSGLSGADLYQLTYDRQGRLWIAGTNGLDRLDTKGKYTHFGLNKADAPQPLPSLMIRSLFEDSNGRVWIGTLDRGAFIWQGDNQRLIGIGAAQGLPNQSVTAINQDQMGNIWLSTHEGLAKVEPRSLKLETFNSSQGIAATTVNRGASYIARDGSFYLGGIEGMSIFKPEQLQHGVADFPVLLTRLKLSNRPVTVQDRDSPLERNISLSRELHLNHTHSMVAFEFAGLSYHQARFNQYAYMLEHFDKQWNEIGSNTSATYTNIPPGRYLFRVKAANSEGQWSGKEASLVVVVSPPPWKTLWAYLFYAACALGLVHLIYRRQRELAALEKEKQLNTALLRINNIKDAFLANTTHELRTPVSGIVGLATALEEELKLPPGETRRKLELIISSGQRLSHLISDILDYTKMADSRIELFKSWVEIYPLVEKVFSIARPLAANKEMALINNTSPDERLWADANRLEQVLINLVSNGIKYSDGGFIKVISERDAEQLNLTVQDSGIGIAQEDLAKLFLPFSQLEASANRRAGGTGLGLAVSRHLIEQHGGEIQVKSVLGQGSQFTISLPILLPDRQEQQAPTAAPLPTSAPFLTGRNLLYADDDTINCMILRRQLAATGANLLEATNGQQAYELLESQSWVDLVILDVQMPHLSGFDVCRKMRASPRWQSTPVIFLTANVTDADKLEAQALAPAIIVLKPMAKERLWQQLMQLLKLEPEQAPIAPESRYL